MFLTNPRLLDFVSLTSPQKFELLRRQVIRDLVDAGVVPVIAPIGVDAEGQTYNCNADTAAGAIAGALKAHRLLLLTDVAGVLDKEKRLLRNLDSIQVGGVNKRLAYCPFFVCELLRELLLCWRRFNRRVGDRRSISSIHGYCYWFVLGSIRTRLAFALLESCLGYRRSTTKRPAFACRFAVVSRFSAWVRV